MKNTSILYGYCGYAIAVLTLTTQVPPIVVVFAISASASLIAALCINHN